MAIKKVDSPLLAYVLFFIWPFLSLVYGLLNFKSKYTKNIVWFFTAFFGYTFIVSNSEMDADRYRYWLVDAHANIHKPYWDLLIDPYVGKGIYSNTDVYGHFLTITISRFTGDHRILFLIVGIVYGYFFSRNIFYILGFLKEKKLNSVALCCLVLLAFMIPFFNINGYRFYTAAHMFLFGIMRVVVEKKYRYLWLCILTPAVHMGMSASLVPAVLYLFIKSRYLLAIPLVVLSTFFTQIDPSVINKNTALAPIFMQNKVSGYTSEEYIGRVADNVVGMNWYVDGRILAFKILMYSGLIILLVKRRKFLNDLISKSLFTFTLLSVCLTNVLANVPSGGRFLSLTGLVAMMTLVYCFQNGYQGRLLSRLIYLFFPITMMVLLVELRIGFDFMGFNTLFLNFFTAPFFPDSIPLIDLFK